MKRAFISLLALAVLNSFVSAADFSALRNPVWTSTNNLRDPSVLKAADGWHVFCSRLAGKNWGSPDSWTIAEAVTRDFVNFENDRDVSPKGHASPGDVIFWHGRWLLPYQTYPATPTQLVFSESPDLNSWSAPKAFLTEARFLPWNKLKRVIDPTLVLDGDVLHCFFIGSANVTNPPGKVLRANLLGHAITRDPKLEHWEILTTNAPLIGVSERAPDGVENIMIFPTGDHWTMIFSEGLANQHLALATSSDLISWGQHGAIELPRQKWMARKYGAPFVWREKDQWLMMLMGEDAASKTTFGLLTSPDGKKWTLLPERPDTEKDVLLFTYFRNNGADGVHLAMTTNGMDFLPLNSDKAIFKPPQWPGQNLTRDASVLYQDGKFRMVWTSEWKGRVFGYAESDDLVHWSESRQVKPFPDSLPADDQPDNIWAPEIHSDPLKQDYFILFASTTPRERNNEDDSNNNGKRGSQYDNRVFITRTKDFQTWTAAKVFYPCDFASIDAVMRRDETNQRWVMVLKCSRDENLQRMPGRNLWLTFANLDLDKPNFTPLAGPIAGNHAPMFSNPDPRKSMAEGPSLLWVGDHWLLTWDEPAGGGLQLATSPDLKTWTHVKSAAFPLHAQHGTLFLAPRTAVGWISQTSAPK